jgi:segregation and condensation protein A
VLEEEVDLLEVDLADVVLAYVEHLERVGDMELDATTEFLVLIASLLLLKSKLLLPPDRDEPAEPDRGEAVDELLARMVEYTRYRAVAGHLGTVLEREHGFRYRSAPLPAHLRRVSLEVASKVYEPDVLARAVGGLLRRPEPVDLSHVARRHVPVEQRLAHLRSLLASRRDFGFDEAVVGADRLTEAVTLFALLELYKTGEADWDQPEAFGRISVRRR